MLLHCSIEYISVLAEAVAGNVGSVVVLTSMITWNNRRPRVLREAQRQKSSEQTGGRLHVPVFRATSGLPEGKCGRGKRF